MVMPTFLPRKRIFCMVPTMSCVASTWKLIRLAPQSANSLMYRSGLSIIRCTSKKISEHFLTDSMTGIPNEMSGTKTPSITSICRYRAPACSTSRICSPSLLKSAAKIDGDKIFILPPLNQLQKSDAQTHPSLQDIFYQKFQRLSTSFFNCSHAPGCSV